ncbi:MAG TPA: hypothetical protein VIY28_13085 [Pseudonocardiaceae bacterium]
MASVDHTSRGRLISIEGLSGVGKTYLTHRVIEAATAAAPGEPPLVIEEFSRRHDDADLGRRLLRTLVTAAKGEHFLRAGFPKSETLLSPRRRHRRALAAPAGPDHRYHRRPAGRRSPSRGTRRDHLHRPTVGHAPPGRSTIRAPAHHRERTVKPHRYAVAYKLGVPIGFGEVVGHIVCDNPTCCRCALQLLEVPDDR